MGETIKQQTRAACGCLAAKVACPCVWAQPTAYRLQVCPCLWCNSPQQLQWHWISVGLLGFLLLI